MYSHSIDTSLGGKQFSLIIFVNTFYVLVVVVVAWIVLQVYTDIPGWVNKDYGRQKYKQLII